MTDFSKKADEQMATLQALEDAVEKNAAGHGELRKRADAIYEARVEQLAKANNVSINDAHGMAAKDEIAQRAYAVSQELAERQEHALDAGAGIAAYVE